MDAQGIEIALLSLSSPGVHFGDDAEAVSLARAANDAMAKTVADHPTRFGFFAAVPLPDVEAATTEAVRALDELGADGIGLMANIRGQYIFDPAVEPLLEQLNRRGATVFVHPNELPGGRLENLPAPVADFTLDTTRAAFGLVLAGAMDRLRDLRIVLSHAGGLIPFLADRFARTISTGVDTSRDPDALVAALKRFYLDTALATGPTALPSVLSFVEPDHLVFGSDSPFASESMSQWFTEQLDGAQMSDTQVQKIARDNATPLLTHRMNAARP